MALTDTDRAILNLERAWWKYPGAKDSAIHERLGVTPTRYYQLLAALLEKPDALAADPLTVRRLIRLRDRRRALRSADRASVGR
ncbi:DUF3263 domain-containing protein [Nocardioides sp.]|uniref:DUF3263 domain-containing protein n=1 Tax=Nocardioides sp. TaxID=35761 RepID=UPI0035125021